ncbi:hypothetical protein DITRI_Ditri03aG0101500 [Diplodiscus trichospermus]
MASRASSSIFQSLKRYIKKPWEITGPCADPEYKSALPKATEYRIRCPATTLQKPIVPTSDPETVFDIKYYSRDQRRNRPPIRRTILKKADVEKMMKEKTFDVNDFPRVYLTAKVEEDNNAVGGGWVVPLGMNLSGSGFVLTIEDESGIPNYVFSRFEGILLRDLYVALKCKRDLTVHFNILSVGLVSIPFIVKLGLWLSNINSTWWDWVEGR